MSSRLVAEKYDLICLDTTRAPVDYSSTNRLSIRNLSYLLNQTCRLLLIAARQRPRVMHLALSSGWSFWKVTLFLLFGRVCRMRIVAHQHSGAFRDYYRTRRRPVRRLIGWVLRQADVVLALSAQWQHFLLEDVRSDLRVAVLPNTVDTHFAIAAQQDDYVGRQTGNVVLFVGWLRQAKGVLDLLRAAPQVLASRKDVVFLLAGGTDSAEALKEMQKYAAELGLEGAVEFLGKVTGQAKLDLYRRATLFVLPSYHEALPYVLLEAMAVGLPVITTPVGAIPEIIEDGRHGFLIQPGDYTALASRMAQLLEDKALRGEMSLANRRLIQRSFMPDMAMARLRAIYDQLLGNGCPPDAFQCIVGNRGIAE